jgi:hypothetical protein
MAGTVLAVCLSLRFADAMPRIFLCYLGGLLVGYAFMGRGFAYIGTPPVFVGEIAIAVGVLAVVVCGGAGLALRSPVSLVLVVFTLWGAARTAPYISTYGIDALRDGVVWGYSVFALLVAAFLGSSDWFPQVWYYYRRLLLGFLVWVPIMAALNIYALGWLPHMSADATLPSFKPGDTGVHLAGAAAFMLAGLHRTLPHEEPSRGRPWTPTLAWAAWLLGFIIVAALNRGGALAVVAAVCVVFALRPVAVAMRLALVGVLTALLVIGFLTFDVSVQTGDRSISPGQIAQNFGSVFGGGDQSNLEG